MNTILLWALLILTAHIVLEIIDITLKHSERQSKNKA